MSPRRGVELPQCEFIRGAKANFSRGPFEYSSRHSKVITMPKGNLGESSLEANHSSQM